MDSPKPPFEDPKFSILSEPADSEPSSATGMFGKASSPAAHSLQEDNLPATLHTGKTASAKDSVEIITATPPPHAVPATDSPASSSPGSFTQMFQAAKSGDTSTAKTEDVSSVSAALPAASSSPTKQPADLTGIFKHVSVGKPSAAVPSDLPAQSSMPGEFTKILQTLNSPMPKADNEPASASAREKVRATEQESFTQIFKVVSGQSVETEASAVQACKPESAPPAKVEISTAVDASAPVPQPGAFTQMFQTLPSDKSAAPTPATPSPSSQPAAEVGFTQIFQSLSPTKDSVPASTPSIIELPIAAPKFEPGSFTQAFQQRGVQDTSQGDPLASLKSEPVSESNLRFAATEPSSNHPFAVGSVRANPNAPAEGGFTKLFQALDAESAGPAGNDPMSQISPTPPATNPIPSSAGGFTQLLRTLSTESASPQAGPLSMPTPPTSSPQSTGPGEFTRIVSGSMLREAQQAQSAASESSVPPPAQAVGQFGFPQMQMPPAPALPKIPAIMSSASPMHGGSASPQMPHFQQPPFAFPPVPPVPQLPTRSKLQQYLPLILVVNVFVLLIVVLIVVFALRHN